jgi:hypothetical protein
MRSGSLGVVYKAGSSLRSAYQAPGGLLNPMGPWQESLLAPNAGYRILANTGILDKELNREKFQPGATSFLGMGSSVYIASRGTFRLEP